MKVSAVTILYNPNIRVIESINSYIHEVEYIYLIDNSTQKLDARIYRFILNNEKIKYYPLGKNYGIAYALNKGCNLAIEENNEWILTMDQDTITCPNIIKQYIRFINNHNNLKIGILCPQIFLINTKYPPLINTFSVVKSTMTSGNLINSEAFIETNGFNSALFIDWVDSDMCFRLAAKGFQIMKLNYCYILHQLGNTKEISILGKHIMYITNHEAKRYYYKTRNALFLANIHPKYRIFFIKSIFSDIIKILFFEKNKAKKIKSTYMGYRDYLKNKMD